LRIYQHHNIVTTVCYNSSTLFKNCNSPLVTKVI